MEYKKLRIYIIKTPWTLIIHFIISIFYNITVILMQLLLTVTNTLLL